jgi:hypothetical protein
VDANTIRSGAALYYIVSGIGANTVDGKTADRGPGSLDGPRRLSDDTGR